MSVTCVGSETEFGPIADTLSLLCDCWASLVGTGLVLSVTKPIAVGAGCRSSAVTGPRISYPGVIEEFASSVCSPFKLTAESELKFELKSTSSSGA